MACSFVYENKPVLRWRIHPITGRSNFHGAIDLAAPGGSPIVAANPGTVIIATYNSSYGYYVVVDHGGGVTTLYAHSSRLRVSVGQSVSRGQRIADVGPREAQREITFTLR